MKPVLGLRKMDDGRLVRKRLRLWLSALAGLLVLSVFGVTIAEAKPPADVVTLTASVGFSGYYANEDWVPVTLHIQHRGPTVQGVIAVQVDHSIGQADIASGSLQWPIRLPHNAGLTKQISLPGLMVTGADVTIYVGGNAVATTTLSGNALGHVALVAVISNTLQKAAYLTGSSDGTNPVQPVAVSVTNFPQSTGALGGLQAVTATPRDLSQLSAQQSTALLTWIRFGGILVVTGTGQTEPTSVWRGYMPILPGPQKRLPGVALSAFANVTDSPGDIVVSAKGLSKRAETFASDGNTPLIASMPIDRGVIWQTSFSPNQGSLLEWSGNPAMWTTLLRNSSGHGRSALVQPLNPSSVLALTAVRDALSPLRVPSLKFWALLFFAYLLLIGPGVFTLLRKSGRATLAWVLLPTLSVVVTVLIYSFGLAVRPPGLLSDAVGVLELAGNGTGESYGVQAFMSPFRGGLTFRMPPGTFALTLDSKGASADKANFIVHRATGTVASFGTAPRWSVRYLYAVSSLSGQGRLHCELSSSFGLLIGEVTNSTPYPLRHVSLFWQDRMYTLGNLNPGQTVEVNRSVGQAQSYHSWLAAYGGYNHDITRGIGRNLAAFASTEGWQNDEVGDNGAMLVATTDARIPTLPPVSGSQKIASSQSLVLVREFTAVVNDSGGPFV